MDDVLDAHAGNRAAELRAAVPAASVVDATVAVPAERAGVHGGTVEILTSDIGDLTALAPNLTTTTADVVHL